MWLLLTVDMLWNMHCPKIDNLLDFKFTFFHFLLCISISFELLANNNDMFGKIADKFPLQHLRLHFVADWCIKNRFPFFLQIKYQF